MWAVGLARLFVAERVRGGRSRPCGPVCGGARGGSTSPTVRSFRGEIAAIQERRAALRTRRKQLEESGRGQLSLTDPDSRLVKTAKGAVAGYNVQITVDSKRNLIAEQQVHTNVTDVGLLAQTAVTTRENLAVEQIDAVADKGVPGVRRCRSLRDGRGHAARAEAGPVSVEGEGAQRCPRSSRELRCLQHHVRTGIRVQCEGGLFRLIFSLEDAVGMAWNVSAVRFRRRFVCSCRSNGLRWFG